MKNLFTILIIVIVLTDSGLSTPSWAESQGQVSEVRPASWAVPITKPGLPNLHRITENLYRGAQPTREGFLELEKMGIKTVINLRAFHSDVNQLQGTSLQYENISFKTWHPEDEDVVRFLQIISDKSRQPFFIHCQHGADRTGMMSAVYRIVMQNWSKEEAITEMTQGEYGFHPIWGNIISYIRSLNIEAIKTAAGINS
jgi:protein tyrosine/serine phosphatase